MRRRQKPSKDAEVNVVYNQMKTIVKRDDFTDELIAEIWVGQSDKENDNLFLLADQNDLWFHLDKMPSAHVWLHFLQSRTDKVVLKSLINKCALLVKEHSKCPRGRTKVCYLNKKSLRKDYSKVGSVILKKGPQIITI